MEFRLRQTRLGLLNSTTRLPFRYGRACLTRCPQAVMEATIEVQGRVQRGYSGESLPPGWFDKTPDLSYRRQIAGMLASIARAERAFLKAAEAPSDFFTAWHEAYHSCHAEATSQGFDNPLLVSFGVSLVERAVMDALARHSGMSFAAAVRANIYRIRPGEIHEPLRDLQPADWLPPDSARSIFVRHTVGFGDPITVADIRPGERLDDGFPQSLEEHVAQSGMRYFKLKISPDIDEARHRIVRIAEVIEQHRGGDYQVTLDANELFESVAQLETLVNALRAVPALSTFLDNVLAIEQPLARQAAFAPSESEALRRMAQWRPVIIDESDATLDAYPRAIGYGYRGTTSKSCKGPVKSILNAGLTWLANRRGTARDYLLTGEDLTCAGIVPLQADLALSATLGLKHVERNSLQYHSGLAYLPESERGAALAAHADLYHEQRGRIAPRITDGRLALDSLHCSGFGFAVLPDMSLRETAEEWRFESLGLGENESQPVPSKC